MNKMMKISGVMVAIMLAGSVTMADPYRGRGDYRGRSSYSDCRPSYSSHHRDYDRDRHGGYYRNDHGGSLAVGLLGLAVVAAVVSAASQPEPVYVQRQVVYSPVPVVYVQQPAPVICQPRPVQVEYVQQQSFVVQQVASYESPQPASMIINVQNSNGSMTPVTLRQIGVQWVGPRGEYYDNLPTVGQLRSVYGF